MARHARQALGASHQTRHVSASMQMVEGRVRTPDGSSLYYRRLGQGPTTVVIPLAAWWGTQADTLADRIEVVLYDPPGRGRSDPAGEDAMPSMDQAVASLEAVRSQLGLQRISLIGWSYLGAVVVCYAAAHPDRVDRLVQVGPLLPRREPYWEQWMADHAARAARLREDARLGFASDDAGSRAADAAGDTRRRRRAMVAAQLGVASAADAIVDTVGTDLTNEHPDTLGRLMPKTMAALGAWDFRETANSVRAPVLTVHGSEDNIPLASCQEWVEVLPNARLLRLAGVGHYPFYECPDLFFVAVAEFLDGRWPAAAAGPEDSRNRR